MMTSHSIYSKDFCNPWYNHPKKYYPPSSHLLPYNLLPSGLFLSGLVPSEPPTTDKVCPWLSSTDLMTSAQHVDTYHCGENVENVVGETDNRVLKETKCHLETIEVPLMEKCI